MKIIDLLDENRYNPLDYERDQQDQMDANKSAFKRREMEHELGHEVDPKQSEKKFKSAPANGVYFYNVQPGQEADAEKVGLFKTKSGKWYSPFENQRANMFFGRGKFWQPKPQESATGGSSSAGSIPSAPGRNSDNLIV